MDSQLPERCALTRRGAASRQVGAVSKRPSSVGHQLSMNSRGPVHSMSVCHPPGHVVPTTAWGPRMEGVKEQKLGAKKAVKEATETWIRMHASSLSAFWLHMSALNSPQAEHGST